MKRDKMLISVNLSFIVICFITRLFIHYENWDIIVTAVTISSSLMILADMFIAVSKYSDNIYNDSQKIVKIALNVSGSIEEKIDELLKCYSNTDRAEDETKGQLENDILNSNSLVLEVENIKKAFARFKRLTVQCKNKWTVTMAIAFLSLICIITFPTIGSFLSEYNSYITVFSFAMVLFSQLIDSFFTEKLEKEKNDMQRIINVLNKLEIKYNDYCVATHRYIELSNNENLS